jgi:hypothetical protein
LNFFNENRLLNWAAYFLYVGHVTLLAGCKSLSAPSWKEAEANDKGVVGDRKSERSHQQIRGTDAQKSDIRLTKGGQLSNRLGNPKNQP